MSVTILDIRMAGIDYQLAGVAIREIFSFTKASLAEALEQIKKEYPDLGCVILSTCNRTEIWLHGGDIAPFGLLCRLKGVEEDAYRSFFQHRQGKEAVHYLMELACGLRSQIFGEDQILTQVKQAIGFSRAYQSADTVLEVLFRDAVTAAKRVKTDLRLTAVNRSMAVGTLELLEEKLGTLENKKCMVIGNGEMGRLAAAELRSRGCQVLMTLRQYKGRDAIIPAGCRAIPYEERMAYLPQMDIVLSATSSPHYTIKKEAVEELLLPNPVTIVDLAVPRDVDPGLKDYHQLSVYDVDDLGGALREEDVVQTQKARELLAEYEGEFSHWYDFREWVPLVQHIGEVTGQEVAWRSQKAIRELEVPQETGKILSQAVSVATQKSVAKLLYGLREYLDAQQLKICMEGLRRSLEEDGE